MSAPPVEIRLTYQTLGCHEVEGGKRALANIDTGSKRLDQTRHTVRANVSAAKPGGVETEAHAGHVGCVADILAGPGSAR